MGKRCRQETIRFLQDNVDRTDADLRDIEYAAINGMLSTLDPHSVLMTPDIYAEMQTSNRGSFGGLGIVISIREGQLTIISPITGTPATRAGLRAGDRIVEINEESTINMPLDEAVAATTAALARHGFGVLTEIDVQATMKKKLDIEMRGYRILGACNPNMANKALGAEDKIGTMLPCNVIVQERDGGVEVAAVDPVASMQAIDNPDLAGIAAEVRGMLQAVVADIGADQS